MNDSLPLNARSYIQNNKNKDFKLNTSEDIKRRIVAAMREKNNKDEKLQYAIAICKKTAERIRQSLEKKLGKDKKDITPEERKKALDDFYGPRDKKSHLAKKFNLNILMDILGRYDKVGKFYNGLANVWRDGKVGLVDENGNEVVALGKYDEIVESDHGRVRRIYKDGKVGLVDENGNEVVALGKYDEIDNQIEDEIEDEIDDEEDEIDDEEDKIDDEEDEIDDEEDKIDDEISESDCGRVRKIIKDGKVGLVDENGNEVVALGKYDKIGSVYPSCGLRDVYKNGKLGLINKYGKQVLDCEYYKTFCYNIKYGLIDVTKGKDGRFLIIDTNGNIVVPYDEYNGIYGFENGLAKVYNKNGVGLIDRKGNEIIPCGKYAEIEWDEGYWSLHKEYMGKEGLADKDGNIVVDCKYDFIGKFNNEGLARVKKDGKYGFIDTNGNEVIACKYDFIGDSYDYMDHFNDEGLARAKKDGKYGYVDTNGNEVIACKYDEVLHVEGLHGLILMKGLNGIYLFDRSGNIISQKKLVNKK